MKAGRNFLLNVDDFGGRTRIIFGLFNFFYSTGRPYSLGSAGYCSQSCFYTFQRFRFSYPLNL
jgi:hypothetical protein